MVRFAPYFHNQAVFKKSECSFFDEVAIDAKSVLTFGIRPLVAELKFRMSQYGRFSMFSLSALPPEGTFLMLIRFSIYDHLVKTATFRSLKDGLVKK